MPAHKGNKYNQKKVDWNQIDKLLEINCTGEEIATVLGLGYETIARHCKKEKGMKYDEYIKKGNENFKVSLKRLQFRSAKGIIVEEDGKAKVKIKPNVTMQIWLGKQYLGQADKQEVSDKNIDLSKFAKLIEQSSE